MFNRKCQELVTCEECGCAVLKREAHEVVCYGGYHPKYSEFYCKTHAKAYDAIDRTYEERYYRKARCVEVTERGEFKSWGAPIFFK